MYWLYIGNTCNEAPVLRKYIHQIKHIWYEMDNTEKILELN